MIWAALSYPVIGLVVAALLAWFDVGPWNEHAFVSMLFIAGCIALWPLIGSAYGLEGLREVGRNRRELARNREYERRQELAVAEAQLRKEGYLP